MSTPLSTGGVPSPEYCVLGRLADCEDSQYAAGRALAACRRDPARCCWQSDVLRPLDTDPCTPAPKLGEFAKVVMPPPHDTCFLRRAHIHTWTAGTSRLCHASRQHSAHPTEKINHMAASASENAAGCSAWQMTDRHVLHSAGWLQLAAGVSRSCSMAMAAHEVCTAHVWWITCRFGRTCAASTSGSLCGCDLLGPFLTFVHSMCQWCSGGRPSVCICIPHAYAVHVQ